MAEPLDPPNFEQALARLEGIIKLMESNEMPLEDMLIRYEEGINLVKFCGEKLDHAEQRIKIIAEDAQGKPKLVDFEPAKAAPTPSAAPSGKAAKSAPHEDAAGSDEVSLF